MLILYQGANIDYAATHGETPLLIAAQRGRASAVRILLQSKTNANLADAGGGTPLLRQMKTATRR